MANLVSTELPTLLKLLVNVGSSSDDEVVYHYLEDVSKICLEDVKLEDADVIVSDTLGEKNESLLTFLRSSSANAALKRSILAGLDLLCGLIKKYGCRLKSSADRIKTVCFQVYSKSNVAAVKSQALECFTEVLKVAPLAAVFTDLAEVASRLLTELAKNDTAVKATVKQQILRQLGLICAVSPSSMIELSDRVADRAVTLLNYQMTRSKAPENSIVAGCFQSLTHLLGPFDRSAFPDQVTMIFNCMAKAIDPNIKTTRYEIPKSALELIAKRGEQFRPQLITSYEDIYGRLIKFSYSKNPEVRKAALAAIETFLRQVGAELADPIEDSISDDKRRMIFNYFLKDFMSLMRTTSSTLRSVSQAIRSYGYFAAAFRKFKGEDEVRDMLIILLEKCFQVCTSEDETTDSKAAFLPSFLQSLASIVREAAMVDESVSESLKVIFGFTLEFYPKLTGSLQESCSYAIVQFMYTVCAMKHRPVKLLSDLVYQVLVQTCKHQPVVEGESKGVSEEGGEEIVTYKNFTTLWSNILNVPRQHASRVGLSGVSELITCIYGETIKGLLRIFDKLDLTIADEQDEDSRIEADSGGVRPGEPVKVKDFQVLINVADMFKVVLEETKTELFDNWAYTFTHSLIRHSSKKPLVSSFYKLLTSTMVICNSNGYFDQLTNVKDEDDDAMDILSETGKAAVFVTHQLISKYHRKVVACMKQYKDDLLISCLKFLFSLPISVVKGNLSATSEALQMGLSLGLTYHPLIGQCLPTLKLLFNSLPDEDLIPQLQLLLPYLDTFLQHADHIEEGKGDEATRKVLKNKQRLKLPPSLLRLANEKTQSGKTEIQKLKLEVLKFLGQLGGNHNQYVINNDRRTLSKLAVSWDTKTHLLFDLPFKEMKVDIYLDAFLPRACELALSSSNRQTKVAACEFVHSLILLLLGRCTNQSEQMQQKKPTDKLFKKLFPVILSLAVDMEQVAKQLFEPLMVQLIHWFSKYPKRKETAILLDSLMEGVKTLNNSALREFSAQCVAEFLKWSIKQTSLDQQRKDPENVKQLLRRVYSMARHPSGGKRLGACDVYNHIYTILREEESLVDKFTLEILVCFVECLALAHSDDASLGTCKEAQKCLNHVERILKAKSALFQQPSKHRRNPSGWTNARLKDAVFWLLDQIGRPEEECRHACMSLITNLTPCLPAEINSRRKLMEDVLSKQGKQYIKGRCEGVTLEGKAGPLQQASPFQSKELKTCGKWFGNVVACLDAYCWLIGTDMVSADTVLTATDGVFDVLSHFVKDVALKSLTEVSAANSVYTPAELEEYNRSKCTVTVRLIDFLTILMSKGKQLIVKTQVINADLWKLIGLCILEPVTVGFNMADMEVMSNLPDILKSLLRVMQRFLDTSVIEQFYQVIVALAQKGGLYDLDTISNSVDMTSTEERHLFTTGVINGYRLLSDVNMLAKCVPASFNLPHIANQLATTVIKGSKVNSFEPTTKCLLESLYALALSIGLPNNVIVEALFADTGRNLYACVDSVLLRYIVTSCNGLIQPIMSNARTSSHQTAAYVIGLLDYLKASSELSDGQKQSLSKTVLDQWPSLQCWWGGETASQTTLSYCICILRKALLLNSTLEKLSHYSEMVDFFMKSLNSEQTEQSQRSDLMDILPFFLRGTEVQSDAVRKSVQDYVNARFPSNSRELPINSSGYHDYMSMFSKILEAMVMEGDIGVLKIVLTVLCREETHAQEAIIQEYLARFTNRLRRLHPDRQLKALKESFDMFKDASQYVNHTIRVAALTRVCLPVLQKVDKPSIIEFFKTNLDVMKRMVNQRESKAVPDALEVIISDKICCYKLIEFMYARLLKEEVFSSGSSLSRCWVANDPTAASKPDSWKDMTKDLIKLSKACKNEDMRGETLHLELRRKLHCVAYNALMAIIANTQVNPDFYRTFLFSGDAVKGCTPLENICPGQPYQFEIELTTLPTRTKKLVSVRESGDNMEGAADTVVYMQTVAESSLTEDLAKYDFTYSQTLSSSRQRHAEKEQEQLDLLYPDSETVEATSTKISQGYVELESDPLNEHECMASFTSLLQHMLRHDITPSAADETVDLPGWMMWLKNQMNSSSTAVNVRHFIARLLLNTEKVFSPYSSHWLPALVNYVTSCCQELHYFAMDVIVLIIVWCDETQPQKEAVGKAMLNKLTNHVMSKVHHERKGIFRNNLDLLKNCLERWKSCLTIDTKTIFDFLMSKDDKMVLTGVQLIGVVIANKIDPYNASVAGDVGKLQFYATLAKALTNRLLSVYSATSEVLGLTFSYLSTNSDESNKAFLLQYEDFVEKGLSSPTVPVHKLVVCLYSINLHYPSFSHRFRAKMLFEVRRLHGDMRQKALEIIGSIVAKEETPYDHLFNIDFTDLLAHRNSHVMQSCLKIVQTTVEKLTAQQLLDWLPLLSKCQSRGNAACRQLAHSIFMNIYNKYKSSDGETGAIHQLRTAAQEQLLLGLSDDSQANRLLVQNFWSADSTLTESVVTRLDGILRQMYSPRTESSFLSYATNLILELTSKSTDFDRAVFNLPLSDCQFTAYPVNATWTQRYSTLAPMYAEGSLSQTAGSLGAGMLRGTQATQQFTATQDMKGQKAFNWLTQSSLDASLDATATESSSLLFTVGKKTSAQVKPRGSTSAGSIDKTDGRSVNKESNPELSALRRRFIKDQESSRKFFAKREARRKLAKQEMATASKQQRENRVTLYRQYRHGDLPDIEIKYSAVITPLQALAQKDSSIARLLFMSTFKAILDKADEGRAISATIVQLIENVLRTSTESHPPLVCCLMDLLMELSKLAEPSYAADVVSDCSIRSGQEPVGVVALEQKLAPRVRQAEEPRSKRRRVTVDEETVDDPLSWVELARLYKSMGHYDIVRAIISENVNVHAHTRQALDMESLQDYERAASLYESVLDTEQANADQLYEQNLIDDGILHCLEQLSRWDEMEEALLANLEQNLSSVWDDSSKGYYLPSIMKCQTRRLMGGKDSSSFLKFLNDSCEVTEQRQLLEEGHGEELAIVYMAKKDFDRARHYYRLANDKFLYDWSTLGQLMVDARSRNVQMLQRLTEMGEFLDVISDKPSVDAVEELVARWESRCPGDLYSTTCWDDVITNRIFYMNMLESELDTEKLVEQRLGMRLTQATQAATSGNIGLASALLRDTYKCIQGPDVAVEMELKWKAAGILIKQKMANAAGISLSTKIKHTESALKAIDKYPDAKVDASVTTQQPLYYQWYSLKNKTWSCALFAVLDSTADERGSCKDALLELADRSGMEQAVSRMAHQALDSIKKSANSEVPSQIASAHIDMVTFADYLLRYAEEASESLVEEHTLGGLKEALITSCTKALNLGSADALAWVPRLLQLVELHPDIIPLFIERTKEVPSWMFISWVSQMVALLDHQHSTSVHHLVMDLAEQYPMAVIYPFKISSESFTFRSAGAAESKARQFVKRLDAMFSGYNTLNSLVRALEQLSQPDALFIDWQRDFADMVKDKKIDKKLIEERYKVMYESLFNDEQRSADQSLYDNQTVDSNSYRREFSKAFGEKLRKLVGRNGEKLWLEPSKVATPLSRLAAEIKDFVSEKLKPPGLLKDYSTWLVRFNMEAADHQLEIPGQYEGSHRKPIPENHVTIAGFDETVLVMQSLRKPKRIVIRGNDEREYKFLVKGGEDLRLDQRIETIFTNIKGILSKNSSCKYLELTTYTVIPINTRLGLIEWMEDVEPLLTTIQNEFTDAETQKMVAATRDYMKKYSNSKEYVNGYSKLSASDCRTWLNNLTDRLPSNVLSRALQSMSRSVESYYMLRDQCITSHAVISTCHYLLGIGDRHLSNFMLSRTSGAVVGIDFGHAFGSATTILPVPELIPFRLTNQFVGLMAPYGTHGVFQRTMVNVLRVLRDNKHQILNLLDIFIKEPSLDWMQNAKKQSTRASFEDDGKDNSQQTEADWYPKEKVKFAKLKMLGAHPRFIMSEELRLNPHVKKSIDQVINHLKPDRAVNKDLRLSVEDQVKALIDHATDANLLARTYIGWKSFL